MALKTLKSLEQWADPTVIGHPYSGLSTTTPSQALASPQAFCTQSLTLDSTWHCLLFGGPLPTVISQWVSQITLPAPRHLLQGNRTPH